MKTDELEPKRAALRGEGLCLDVTGDALNSFPRGMERPRAFAGAISKLWSFIMLVRIPELNPVRMLVQA